LHRALLTYEIDYEETFSLVAKLNCIKVLLSMDANLDWELHQLDIKNAFLNGSLEEVFIRIPFGFESFENQSKVYKLKKAFYGPKQSPRARFTKFSATMKKLGYQWGRLITPCLSSKLKMENLF